MHTEDDNLIAISRDGIDDLVLELAAGIATTQGYEDHVVLVVDLLGPERVALGAEISSTESVADMLILASVTTITPRTLQIVPRLEAEALLARYGLHPPRPLGPLPRDQVWVVRVSSSLISAEVVRPMRARPSTRRRPPR
jgi:hypothetical protein